MDRKYFLLFFTTMVVVLVTLCVFISNPTLAGQSKGLLKALQAIGFAPVAQTGQTNSFAVGDDGDLQVGIAPPVPRFTDNDDGTVTDNLTGLIWLKNANCGGTMNWYTALTYCDDLANGSCGLSDGSVAGDWRLANVREMRSLIHYGFYDPSVPDTVGTGQWSEGDPFSGVAAAGYWSSTTGAYHSGQAWVVSLSHGRLVDSQKTDSGGVRVWPVRGGN